MEWLKTNDEHERSKCSPLECLSKHSNAIALEFAGGVLEEIWKGEMVTT